MARNKRISSRGGETPQIDSLVFLPDHNPQRRPFEPERGPELVFQVTQVRGGEHGRFASKERERGRFGRDLSHIQRFRRVPFFNGNGVVRQRLLEEQIEAIGGHPVRERVHDPGDGVEQVVDGLGRKRRPEDNGNKGEKGKLSLQFQRKLPFGLGLIPAQIPFIDEHDTAPSLPLDEPCNLGVLVRDALDSIE